MQQTLRLGVRAHDFGKMPLEELASRVARAGYESVQLAIGKALSDVPAEPDALDRQWAGRVRKAFEQRGIHIAVLGCYINPVHPDPKQRKANLDRFRHYLSLAGDFGCDMVASETGSLHPDGLPCAENDTAYAMEQVIESFQQLTRFAASEGVHVGIENAKTHIVDRPSRMKQVLDSIPDKALQCICDPVNFLDAGNCHTPDVFWREAFSSYGDRIVRLHAKDVARESTGFAVVQAGTGRLDYPSLLGALQQTRVTDILMEDLKPQEIDTAGEAFRHFLTGRTPR